MIETLYFKCYYAYLKKDLEETRMFFEMLRDELSKTKLKNPLPKEYLSELKKVRDSLKTGSFINRSWVNDTTPLKIPNMSGEKFKGNQDDLVKKIHFEASTKLKELLGASEDFHLYNIEHPCGIHGAVDMVYADGDASYPIEVKKDEGKHDIISQISKYDLSFKLHLHLKMYKRVKPVTICASYQNNVIKELLSIGVVPLYYRISDGRLHLNRIGSLPG